MSRKDEPLPAITFEADAVVAEILGDASRRQDELKLSPEERKQLIASRRKADAKKEAARQKAQAQLPNRMNLFLPQDLKTQITEQAEQLRVPISQLVTFFLYEMVAQYARGAVEIDPYLRPSRSPRYDFNLLHPRDAEREQKLTTKTRKTRK